MSLTNSTRLFSERSTTWSAFGSLLKISFTTAWPIDPAPPNTKNLEFEISPEIKYSLPAKSVIKASSRPINDRMFTFTLYSINKKLELYLSVPLSILETTVLIIAETSLRPEKVTYVLFPFFSESSEW